MTQEDKHF